MCCAERQARLPGLLCLSLLCPDEGNHRVCSLPRTLATDTTWMLCDESVPHFHCYTSYVVSENWRLCGIPPCVRSSHHCHLHCAIVQQLPSKFRKSYKAVRLYRIER